MAEKINLLFLGDEGVGKSSISCAYISRHFPREVPPVMIDIQIPREMVWGNHNVNIIDSSARPNDREELVQKIHAADTVIAVYDVTRPETLESLINEWLPLVRELSDTPDEDNANYHSKQIFVLGNKCDLLIDDEEIMEENRRLEDLLKENGMCVFGSICSAKQLDKVDAAMYRAALISLCPLQPLYDASEKEFTPAGRRAFQRIFRMFDVDDDNLLSDDEICQLQNHCFLETFGPSDLVNMKRLISTSAPPGSQLLHNNCITFDGLLRLVENGLLKDNFSMPWTMLKMCNYNNQLNLEIPPEVTTLSPNLRVDQLCELSTNAVRFLLNLAHRAYEENERPFRVDSDSVEECLTAEMLRSIFASTLSPSEAHPWVDPPTYKTNWKPSAAVSSTSVATSESSAACSQIPQSLLLGGLPHIDANLSFDNWINHWKLLALMEPVLVQTLLYKLGYYFREDLGLQVSTSTTYHIVQHLQQQRQQQQGIWWQLYSFFYRPKPSKCIPRSAIKVCLLGDNGVGKATFVWHVSGLRPPGAEIDVEVGVDYRKPLDTIVVGGCTQFTTTASTMVRHQLPQSVSAAMLSNTTINTSNSAGTGSSPLPPLPDHLSSPTFFLCFAAIPQEHYDCWVTEEGLANCDIAVLMFQCGDHDSLNTALLLEAGLPREMPRIFVGTKADLLRAPSSMSMMHMSTSSSSGNALDQINNNSNNTTSTESRASSSSLQRTLSPLEEQYQRRCLEHERVMQRIQGHIAQTHLPQVVLTSTLDNDTASGVAETMATLREVALYPQRAIPSTDAPTHEQIPQKQKPQPTTSKHHKPSNNSSNHNTNNINKSSKSDKSEKPTTKTYDNHSDLPPFSLDGPSSSSTKSSLTAVNVGLAALSFCSISMLVFYRQEVKDLFYALFAQTQEVLHWTAQQPTLST